MNDKKLIAMAVIIFTLVAVMLSSYAYNIKKSEDEQISDGRFVADRNLQGIIITNTKTGIQYLFINYGYGEGMTVLIDEDGKPLVKEVSVDD